MNINATLFVQALSFAALIWFTVRFVWPMITDAMDERTKRIADGLAAAEAGRQSLERSSKQAEEAIAQARGRAAEIVAQAEKRASQMIEEAKVSARPRANAWSPAPGPKSSRKPRARAKRCAARLRHWPWPAPSRS